MHENDGSVPHLLFYRCKRVCRIPCLPVKRIDIPLDERLVDKFVHGVICSAAGSPKQRHIITCKALDQFVIGRNLMCDRITVRVGQNNMLIGVICNFHSFVVFTKKFGSVIIRLVHTDDEERRLCVILSKHIQNKIRVPGRSIIIRQCDKLLLLR